MHMDVRSLFTRVSISRLTNPPPVVGVMRLSGPIGGLGPLRPGMTLGALEPAIERAFRLPRLRAVALAINSPGGTPTQSDLIARRIRDLADEKKVPVFAFCEDVAASGGYWLACAADEIFARETSIVGSIGVVAAGFGFPELLRRIGVERRVYTAGDKKAMLDPFREEKPDEVAHLRRLQEDMHETFKALVRARRDGRLRGDEAELFSGAFWTGRQAVELGLVDGLGEMRQVLRARYGDRVVLRRVDVPRSWWRRRLGLVAHAVGEGDAGSGRSEGYTVAAGVLAAVEERLLWSRFGL